MQQRSISISYLCLSLLFVFHHDARSMADPGTYLLNQILKATGRVAMWGGALIANKLWQEQKPLNPDTLTQGALIKNTVDTPTNNTEHASSPTVTVTPQANQSEVKVASPHHVSKEGLSFDYEPKNGTSANNPHQGSTYNDGNGNIGYQTHVGNNTVSVGTDIGSIIRFGKDAGDIIFGGESTESIAAAQESSVAAEIAKQRRDFEDRCISFTPAQLEARKSVLEIQYASQAKESKRLHNVAYSGEAKKQQARIAQKMLPEIDAEKARIAHELKTVNQELQKHENSRITKQITHTVATGMVATTQLASTVKTSESMTPIVNSKTRAVGDILAMRNEPEEHVDMETWKKLLNDTAKNPSKSETIPPVSQTTTPTPWITPQTEYRINQANTAVQMAEVTIESAKLLTPYDHTVDPYVGHLARWSLGSCVFGVTASATAVLAGEAIAPGVATTYTMPVFIGACKYCFVAAPASGALTAGHTVVNVVDYATSTDPNHQFFNNDKLSVRYNRKQTQKLKTVQSSALEPQEKTVAGCGSTTPVAPLVNSGYPGTPMPVEQNPGLIPLPVEKPEPLINVPYVADNKPLVNVPPVDINKPLILTKSKNDGKVVEQEKKQRYDGPRYIRTEDWVETLPKDIQNQLVRTTRKNKDKRLFKFETKFGDIGKKDMVAVDSIHFDHLEVFNSKGDWKFAANFDGTKNEQKTEKVKIKRTVTD